MPTALEKPFRHNTEMQCNKSIISSGTLTSVAFTSALTIEISKVGRLLLRVTSRFVSAAVPFLTTFVRTSKAA